MIPLLCLACSERIALRQHRAYHAFGARAHLPQPVRVFFALFDRRTKNLLMRVQKVGWT